MGLWNISFSRRSIRIWSRWEFPMQLSFHEHSFSSLRLTHRFWFVVFSYGSGKSIHWMNDTTRRSFSKHRGRRKHWKVFPCVRSTPPCIGHRNLNWWMALVNFKIGLLIMFIMINKARLPSLNIIDWKEFSGSGWSYNIFQLMCKTSHWWSPLHAPIEKWNSFVIFESHLAWTDECSPMNRNGTSSNMSTSQWTSKWTNTWMTNIIIRLLFALAMPHGESPLTRWHTAMITCSTLLQQIWLLHLECLLPYFSHHLG